MIKEKLQAWSNISAAIGKVACKLPFRPNFYSWMTLPIAVVAFSLVMYGHIKSSVFVFLLSGLFDLIDGAVARQSGQASHRGAFLDGCMDRVVDFLILFSYFYIPLATPLMPPEKWIYIAGFVVILPSFIVAYANHRQAVPDPDEKIVWRILNRGEMFALMMLVLIIAQYSALWAGYLLVTLVVLSSITVVQSFSLAMIHAQHQIRKMEDKN